MTATMKQIYGAARALGFDDEMRRDFYQREVGKRSLTQMTPGDQVRVLQALQRVGAPRGAARRAPLTGPYAKKLQALWVSAWNLGIVHQRADAAMLAFIRRQTGIEDTRFLRDAADARKAVEALKQWLARDAGVEWSAWPDPADAVIAAQGKLLGLDKADIDTPTTEQQGFNAWRLGDVDAAQRRGLTLLLGDAIRETMGER